MASDSVSNCTNIMCKFDLDNGQVYDPTTEENLNDITDITEEQLKEILDIKKELQKQPKQKFIKTFLISL